MENNEIKIDIEVIKKDEAALSALEYRLGDMRITWTPHESEGEVVDALVEQVKAINVVLKRVELLIAKTTKLVKSGREEFEKVDSRQAEQWN